MHDCGQSHQGVGDAAVAGQACIGVAPARGEGRIASEPGGQLQPRYEGSSGGRLVLGAAETVSGGLAVSGSPGKSANGEHHDEGERDGSESWPPACPHSSSSDAELASLSETPLR
jgi:hypothetical protein